MSDAGVLTAAEIAASLGIPLDGKVACKGVRWPPETAAEAEGPPAPLTLGNVVRGLRRLVWGALGRAYEELMYAPFCKPHRPPYASRVVATPYELRVLWGGGWSVHSWDAVRQAARRGAGWQLVIHDLDCQLKNWRVAEAVVRTAQMVMSRRRRAGWSGLRFVDEPSDAALSLAPSPDEAPDDRGLSPAEP